MNIGNVLIVVLLTSTMNTQQWQPEMLVAEDCALKWFWYFERGQAPPEPLRSKGLTLNSPKERLKKEAKKWNDDVLPSYERYLQAALKSNYYFANGSIHRLKPQIKDKPEEEYTFRFLQQVSRKKVGQNSSIDGVKVILCDNDSTYEVYYREKTKLTERSQGFSIRLTIHKQSGRIED